MLISEFNNFSVIILNLIIIEKRHIQYTISKAIFIYNKYVLIFNMYKI